MRFTDTAIPWTILLPVGLLAVWLLGEWFRHRRMSALGDARILGIAHYPWWIRILRILMLCAALAAAAEVLHRPATADAPARLSSRMVLVLDTASFTQARQAGLFESEDLVAAIQEVVEQAEGAHFTVYLSHRPDRPAVPETEDGPGVLVMISGMEFGAPPPAATPGAGIAEIAERESDERVSVALVVLSAGSAEDVARELAETVGRGGRLLAVRIPGRGLAREFGIAESRLEWSWSPSPDAPRKYLARVAPAANPPEGEQSSHLPVQLLALVILAALVGENLLALATSRRWVH